MPLLKSKEERAEIRAARERAAVARQRRDENPARRWEYKVVWSRKGRIEGLFGSGGLQLALDKWGSHGWELVFMTTERLVFKREVTDLSEAEREELSVIELPTGDEE